MSAGVLRVRVDFYMEAKKWDQVVAVAKSVCATTPKDEGAWIAWAYALREMQQVSEAREVLLKAEPLNGESCSVLHYNLACYYCLLNDLKEARRRFSLACKMDNQWKAAALEDEDLKALWGEIAAS
jgi:Flp pilus assembly protein TadD